MMIYAAVWNVYFQFPTVYSITAIIVFAPLRELQSVLKTNGVIKPRIKVCCNPSPEMVTLYPNPSSVFLLHLVWCGPNNTIVAS